MKKVIGIDLTGAEKRASGIAALWENGRVQTTRLKTDEEIVTAVQVANPDQSVLLSLMEGGVVARLKKRMREMERMKTWVFGAANRDDGIWKELRSRFFTIYLKEYSQADYIQITRAVLISREKVEN